MNIPETAMEGTVVFSGLRAAPRIEAKISEKKPDGTLGKTVPDCKETLIGRENCDLSYPQDMLLSPRHASITMREGKLVLKDLNSQNGSFIRQRQDTELSPGDVFLLGRELFRFITQSLDESPNKEPAQGTVMWTVPKLQKGPLSAKLEHIKLNGEMVAEFRLEKPEITLGRTTGDLVFKDDPVHVRNARPHRGPTGAIPSSRFAQPERGLSPCTGGNRTRRRRRVLHGRTAFPRGIEERRG